MSFYLLARTTDFKRSMKLLLNSDILFVAQRFFINLIFNSNIFSTLLIIFTVCLFWINDNAKLGRFKLLLYAWICLILQCKLLLLISKSHFACILCVLPPLLQYILSVTLGTRISLFCINLGYSLKARQGRARERN